MSTSARRRWFWPIAGAIALLAVVIAGIAFLSTGMRMFVVETPSMGTAAPVGSLVVTRSTPIGDITAGEIVAFQQSGDAKPHTHRVTAADGDTLRTRGDINGAEDPRPVDDTSLIGQAVFVAPVLGWVMKMLPIFLIVSVVGILLTLRVRNPLERFRYRVLAAFCGLAIAIAYVKPILGAALLWMRVDRGGDDPQATAKVVSTGLLPIRVVPLDDGGHASAVLSPTGTTGEAVATKLGADGRFAFYPQPALDFWWWVAIIVFCLLPVAVLGGHALLHRKDPLWLGAGAGADAAGAEGAAAAGGDTGGDDEAHSGAAGARAEIETLGSSSEHLHSAGTAAAGGDSVGAWVNQENG